METRSKPNTLSFRVYVTPEEKTRILHTAADCRLSMSAYCRTLALGGTPPSRGALKQIDGLAKAMMAVREMLAKQLLNTRSQADKNYHLLVSFQRGEQPTPAQLRKIEAALCARLGYDQHQRVAAVHYDTDHTHMHIAINKIHPKKLTIHTPYYDFSVLGKACVELEQQFRLAKDNHEPTGKTRGEWCAAIRPEKQYLRAPERAQDNPLREEYEKRRETENAAKAKQLAVIALEHTKKKEGILAENVADGARAKSAPLWRFQKRRLYAAIHQKYRSQMDALIAETKRARKAAHSEWPRQNWTQWLQAQAKAGRLDAIEALRKRAFSLTKKNIAALRGKSPVEPRLIPEQKIDGVTKRGSVIYDLGTDAVRDDGESFRISARASADTDVMALRMAQRRFGNVIFVDGDYAFRSRMLRAAVEGKVFVKFGDPIMERQRNEMFRHQYQERKKERLQEQWRPRTESSSITRTGLSFEERWNRDMNSARKPDRREEEKWPQAEPGSAFKGLSMAEMWNLHSNSTHNPVRHKEEERPRIEIGTVLDAQCMGLSNEEIREIIRSAVHQPERSSEQTKDARSSNGHDRDDESTRGASMSR